MSFCEEKKLHDVIIGYARLIKNVYITMDIINLIHQFYDKRMKFNVYDHKGFNIFNKCTYFTFNYRSLYFMDDNDYLFVKGFNEYGQLGINKRDSEINSIHRNHFFGDTIKFIGSSICSWHCIAYTKNNELYGFGRNHYNETGIMKSDGFDPIFTPKLIKMEFDTLLKDIKSGTEHTIFLCQNGIVYGCGKNTSGQLTEDYKMNNHKHSIQEIVTNQNVTSIDCCCNSSFILTKNYELYGFGSNDQGLLGIKNENTRTVYSMEMTSKNVKMFSCGGGHMGYLTLNNVLYMFGKNIYGQCGYPYTDNRSQIHRGNVIKLQNETIISLKCGYYHTIIKTKNHDYYSFGKNKEKQLLIHNCDQDCVHVPTKLSKDYLHSIIKSKNKIIDLIPHYKTTYIIGKYKQ